MKKDELLQSITSILEERKKQIGGLSQDQIGWLSQRPDRLAIKRRPRSNKRKTEKLDRQLPRWQWGPAGTLPSIRRLHSDNVRVRQTGVPILAHIRITAKASMQKMPEMIFGGMQCQPFRSSNQNGPAPVGEIRSPARAKLIQPGLGGLALLPGQIGERAGGVAGRLASLQGRHILRIDTRGAGGAGQESHETRLPQNETQPKRRI